jgi:ubiquinone/menaquinone biosynthesis C-methylase UbiE
MISPIRLGIQKRKDPRFHHLPIKQYAELKYWESAIDKYIAWYQGSTLGTFPAPNENERVTDYDLRENAIMTWINVYLKQGRYLRELKVDADYFKGLSVLDIGCGPIPFVLEFKDCQRYGLDQLIDEYKVIGFPLDDYSSEVTYLKGGAESIPVDDDFFDAVVSVNAIDHVDDFGKAAREILRILKPQGSLRMHVHYHKPTVFEPVTANDEKILDYFGEIGIRKIHEKPDHIHHWEKHTIWSNAD